jgi:tetratricopeptide (TPR) repeat protein
MKRFLFLISAFVFSINIFSLDFNSIMKHSNIYNKNVIVFFYQEDEVWIDFSADFFTGEHISRLGQRFNICFLPSDKFLNLRNYLSVPSGNHIVLLNPNGIEIDRIKLTYSPARAEELLDYIFDLSKNPQNFINLKRKVGKYPDNYFFSYELSKKYDRRGMYKQAELELINTINLHPTFPDAYISLARLYRKTGNFRESHSILTIASGIIRNSQNIILEKIKTYIESGDLYDASKLLEKFKPDSDKLIREKLLAEVICYSLTGEHQIAQNSYRELKKLDDLSIYTETAKKYLNEK